MNKYEKYFTNLKFKKLLGRMFGGFNGIPIHKQNFGTI